MHTRKPIISSGVSKQLTSLAGRRLDQSSVKVNGKCRGRARLVARITAISALVVLTTMPLVRVIAFADRGRLSGSIVDQSGAQVSGARVVLRDDAGVAVYQTRSDGEGKFSISNVVDGRYRLTVEAPGFKQA